VDAEQSKKHSYPSIQQWGFVLENFLTLRTTATRIRLSFWVGELGSRAQGGDTGTLQKIINTHIAHF
jgi:hypothetical protein